VFRIEVSRCGPGIVGVDMEVGDKTHAHKKHDPWRLVNRRESNAKTDVGERVWRFLQGGIAVKRPLCPPRSPSFVAKDRSN
jgi:hypothetical protein